MHRKLLHRVVTNNYSILFCGRILKTIHTVHLIFALFTVFLFFGMLIANNNNKMQELSEAFAFEENNVFKFINVLLLPARFLIHRCAGCISNAKSMWHNILTVL